MFDNFTGERRRDYSIDSYTGVKLGEREIRLDTTHRPTSLNTRVSVPWKLGDEALAQSEREARKVRREMLRAARKLAAVKVTGAPKMHLSKRERVERTLASLSPENRARLIAAMTANYVAVA